MVYADVFNNPKDFLSTQSVSQKTKRGIPGMSLRSQNRHQRCPVCLGLVCIVRKLNWLPTLQYRSKQYFGVLFPSATRNIRSRRIANNLLKNLKCADRTQALFPE